MLSLSTEESKNLHDVLLLLFFFFLLSLAQRKVYCKGHSKENRWLESRSFLKVLKYF